MLGPDPLLIKRIYRAAVSQRLRNIALEYPIKGFQVNQEGSKLNVIHHFLAYVDDVNILGQTVHTVKENAEALVVVTKEIGLEVNGDKNLCK